MPVNDFTQTEINTLLHRALSRGGDFADIYLSRVEQGVITLEEKRIQRFHRGYSHGCGLRVMKGDFTAYFHSNDCAYDSLLALSEEAAAAVGGGIFSDFVQMGTPLKVRNVGENWELQRIGTIIKEVKDYTLGLDAVVKQVSLAYSGGQKETLIGNSRGCFALHNQCRKRFFVKVVVAAEGELQRAVVAIGDTEKEFKWDAPYLCGKVDEAVARAKQLLTAKPAPAGAMPVILSASAGGTMVHEACGHGLEGDHIEKGLSVYCHKLGKQVAAPEITVVDDATLDGHYGSYALDDEGQRGRKNVLIKQGILQNYLYDLRTARKLGVESSGNGRRESYRSLPQVRMSNTYIAPGKDDPDAILADTKRGLYVKKMGGGQVNTTNGDFVFEVSEGYMIERGEVTYPVKNATLIGNGPKTLNSIFAVGDDLGFAIGTCGKGGQSVPVGDGQPTLGIREMLVGGTAK